MSSVVQVFTRPRCFGADCHSVKWLFWSSGSRYMGTDAPRMGFIFFRKLQVRLHCTRSAHSSEALRPAPVITGHGRPGTATPSLSDYWLLCLPSQGGVLAGLHSDTTLAVANNTASVECSDGCPCLALGLEGCKSKALGQSRASVPRNLKIPSSMFRVLGHCSA